MAWKNDEHGIVFGSSEIKMYRNGHHTWAMKLSQISKSKSVVRIVTYSLPNLDYTQEQLGRRPQSIFVVCHSKFLIKAKQLKSEFPGIEIAVNSFVHSKVCMIEPSTIYVGSANFGLSDWHETIVGVRSKAAHDWYLENSFIPLWRGSKILKE